LNYLIVASEPQLACARGWANCPYTPTFELPPPAELAGSNVLYWPVVYNPDDTLLPEIARSVGSKVRILRTLGRELPPTYEAFTEYAKPLAAWIEPGKPLPKALKRPLVEIKEADPPKPINGVPVSHLVPAEAMLSKDFIVDGKGRMKPVVANAILMLEHAPAFRGLCWDEFASKIVIRGESPLPTGEWDEHHDTRLAAWMQHQGLLVGKHLAYDAAEEIAKRRPFHPVREYLDSLVWDGEPRCDLWLSDYCEVDNTEFVQAVGAKWLIGAVARVYRPGCKMDNVLIFQGPEGMLKSGAFEVMGREWFSDNMPDLDDSKESAHHVAGVWIIELAELSSMRAAAQEQVWAFISRKTDRYRRPYGHHVIKQPRQCVLAGTTNKDVLLKGDENQRRFWPVTVRNKIELGRLRDMRDQLWAEAVCRFRAGEPWWLQTDALVKAAKEETERRRLHEEWAAPTVEYLVGHDETTVTECLHKALGLSPNQCDRGKEMRMADTLRELGWTRAQVRRHGVRLWVYVRPD